MKLLLSFLIFQITILTFSSEIYVKPFGKKYVLANKYLKAVINVEQGGRVEKFTDLQTGKELTVLESSSVAPQGSGLFGERFFSNNSGNDRGFENDRYAVFASQTTDHSGELELIAVRNGIKIKKKFIITKGRTSLAVKYCITNLRKKNITGRLWCVNMISTKSPEFFKIFYPYGGYGKSFLDHKGIEQNTKLKYSVGSNPENNNSVVNNPAFGWMGVLDNRGNGAVFELDFANLDRLYSFLSPSSGFKVPTVEWFTRRFELKPIEKGLQEAASRPELTDPLKDYTYKTGCSIMPIAGFSSVDACNNGIVAWVKLKGRNAVLNLCSDRKLSGIELELKVIGPNKKIYGKSRVSDVNLMPGKNIKIKLTAAGLEIDDKLLNLNLKNSSGALIASMFIPRFRIKAKSKFFVPTAGKKDISFSPREDVGEFGGNFEESSIDWGKTLGKRLRILAIYPYKNHREVAEFFRRFNVDITPVELNRPHVFGFSRPSFTSWKIPEPAELLKKKLKDKFDVVLVCGGVLWNTIPEKLKKGLMHKIKNGTGLVFVNPERSRYLTRSVLVNESGYMTNGVPVNFISGLNKFDSLKEVVETGRIGKGRVVLLKYNTVPFNKLWRTGPRGIVANVQNAGNTKVPYWEYYFSLAGRALRYASNCEPEVQIVSASTNKLLIENSHPAFNGKLEINIFNKQWQKVESISKRVALKNGNNKIKLFISPEKLTLNGEYYINIFLKKNNKICDWYSFVKIEKKNSCIAKLKLAKTVFPEMTKVSGNCLLKEGIKGKIRISLQDMHGRIIAVKTYSVNSREIPFSLTPGIAPLSTLCNLRVELLCQNKVVDVMEEFLTFNITSERDVKFIIWGAGEANHWTKKLEMKQLKRIGFDWCTGFHASSCDKSEADAVALNVLLAGMRYIPLGIHRLSVKHADLKKRVRTPCLRDPEYLTKMQSDVRRYANWYKRFFPPYYFVADENSLGYYSQAHDFCVGPYCMTKFRVWLKLQYGTLEKLNKEWNSNFKSWNSVVPMTLSNVIKSGRPSPWIDHRRFMFKALGEAVAKQREVLKEFDPLAGLAVSGMGEPLLHNGFDWYDLEKSLELTVAYLKESGRVMDPMRSFLKPGGMLSAWNGYGTSNEYLNWRHWHEVINSFYAPAFWYIGYLINHGDSSISDCGKGMQKTIRDIRDSGIGKLLMEAIREPSRVGLLYSTDSLIATGITGAKGFVNTVVYNANLDGWSGLIRDCGFQPPVYLSSEQLLAGYLKPSKISFFILPLACSLDDREIEALENYVKAGGVLVADAVPGCFQLNGNPRKTNKLFKVFGCKYEHKDLGRENISVSLSRYENLPMKVASKHIKVIGAKVFGTAEAKASVITFGGMKVCSRNNGRKIPAFLVNRHGKGTGIYLNTLFSEYDNYRAGTKQSRRIVNAILEILRTTKGKTPSSHLPTGSELIKFSLKGTKIFAMTRIPRADTDETQFKIKMVKSGYVYDVRQKKLLGLSDEICGDLKPGSAKVFAVLPQPIGKLFLAAEKMDKGIKFRISLPGADSVVRIQIIAPDGKARKYYASNLLVEKQYRGKINLGINERHGKWKLVARDMISGRCVEQVINFK
jgi:hypothetical protein